MIVAHSQVPSGTGTESRAGSPVPVPRGDSGTVRQSHYKSAQSSGLKDISEASIACNDDAPTDARKGDTSAFFLFPDRAPGRGRVHEEFFPSKLFYEPSPDTDYNGLKLAPIRATTPTSPTPKTPRKHGKSTRRDVQLSGFQAPRTPVKAGRTADEKMVRTLERAEKAERKVRQLTKELEEMKEMIRDMYGNDALFALLRAIESKERVGDIQIERSNGRLIRDGQVFPSAVRGCTWDEGVGPAHIAGGASAPQVHPWTRSGGLSESYHAVYSQSQLPSPSPSPAKKGKGKRKVPDDEDSESEDFGKPLEKRARTDSPTLRLSSRNPRREKYVELSSPPAPTPSTIPQASQNLSAALDAHTVDNAANDANNRGTPEILDYGSSLTTAAVNFLQYGLPTTEDLGGNPNNAQIPYGQLEIPAPNTDTIQPYIAIKVQPGINELEYPLLGDCSFAVRDGLLYGGRKIGDDGYCYMQSAKGLGMPGVE